jgi:hypothetical protein
MPPNRGTVLTSWKEIASYLGKGVRTVQRWEGQFGLPVRRPNEKVKGVVYASREELDQWLARHWLPRPGKFTLAQPANGPVKTSVVVEITASHNLLLAQRELVQELRRSLELLAARCQELASNMSRARALSLHPVFPLLNERRPPRAEAALSDRKRRG